MFKTVGVACVLAMERSKHGGAKLPCKKSAVISMTNEEWILTNHCTSKAHLCGLQCQNFFYLLCCFNICGGNELHGLQLCDFAFGSDESGQYVGYDKRTSPDISKNYKISLDCYEDWGAF